MHGEDTRPWCCYDGTSVEKTPEAHAPSRRSGRYYWLLSAVGLYFAGFLVYAETRGYTGDEGFHFLTDQLIRAGMRPYLDFCYPQASLNNYWNVLWMGVFGESWRAIHAVTTVLATLAVFLMADFVFTRFPYPKWRLSAALSVIMLAGLNQLLVEYGPLGQAYGMCLFANAMAFRCAVAAVHRRRIWLAMTAGIFAGVAAASSLLSAVAPVIILLWMFFRNHVGSRWWKAVAAGVGTVIPFAPMIWLFIQGPVQVWFNLVDYHVRFRKLYWSETTQHDLEVMGAWIDSGQALLLGLLALAGLVYVARHSKWTLALRSEFYLCAWLSLGFFVELARAHPTFQRYYVLAVPFLGVLAAVGVFALVSRVAGTVRPVWCLLLLFFLMVLNLGKSLYERRDLFTWQQYETMARKILQVTPPGGLIWADEQMYFVTRKRPMPGLEFGYSHKVSLPPAKMALLHIVSEDEQNRRVKARTFSTIFSCDSDDINSLGLNSLYNHKVEMYDCTIFWGDRPPEGASAVTEKTPSVGK